VAGRRTTPSSSRPSRRPRADAGPVGATPPRSLDDGISRSAIPAGGWLARQASRLGIRTVRDLLFHLPRAYADLTQLHTLGQLGWLPEGTSVSVRATVQDLRVEPTFRRRVERTVAFLADATGNGQAVWFGRRFIQSKLRPGDRVVMSGRLRFRGSAFVIENPEFQVDAGGEVLHAGRIVPVYRTTTGLTAARLRTAIHDALDRYADALDAYEYLPEDVLGAAGLPGIADALRQAHFPDSDAAKEAALRRLAFDELLALQVGMVSRRRARTRESAARVVVGADADRRIRQAIVTALRARVGPDVELTPDQAAAMDTVAVGLAGTEPMVRLLQGDVGSGKTAVAAYALAAVALDGGQAALLAPTDLLARQHAATLAALVADLDLPVTLLTGSLRGGEARARRASIADGTAGVVVGTHALISEAVEFSRLRLAVVDEQHRFGVAQRAALEAKASEGAPHLLLMTATPIPRTLGQVFYADLDVSDLRTPPAGRVPIRTGIRRPDDLESTWAWVRGQAAAGHRTFVVVPHIGDAEGAEDVDGGVDAGAGVAASDDAVAATAEAERLGRLLAPLRVGLVHGRMRPAERDAEMSRFRDGDLDVLVGTTVVEVGVDVPEATMMVVEGADRFGLAQLHQLRGRVGRGTAESFCVLVSDASEGTTAYARLDAIRATRDGFALAEEDFRLRREGDVLGLEQSGLPRLRIASLQRPEHRDLAVSARAFAEDLVDDRGALRLPRAERLRRELEAGWLARVALAETDETTGAA
jgi:ATP-dependent DNA helicase RecG